MRKFFFAIAILSCFCFAECKKNKHSPPPDNPYGLPNATQEGKNTLGFLLNGEPWSPKGFNGTANLSIDVDFEYNRGVFGIAAYRILSTNNRQYFGFGISDSLNFLPVSQTAIINSASLGRMRFENSSCSYFSTDADILSKGSISVSKLDRVNRIIAGSFSGTLYKYGCDTIYITEGRFDMKF